MTAFGVATIVLVCVLAGALFGMLLSKVLPQEHLSSDAKDVIKVTMAMGAAPARSCQRVRASPALPMRLTPSAPALSMPPARSAHRADIKALRSMAYAWTMRMGLAALLACFGIGVAGLGFFEASS